MLSFEDARQTMIDHVKLLGVEHVSLLEAAGRVLSEDIRAPWPMPQWDNSAMDGYAVRTRDCQPGRVLQIDGYIPAGGAAGSPVAPGSAAKIMTGAPIPEGADAIIPFEDADEKNQQVHLRQNVTLYDHIRFAGEDVTAGETILRAGTILRPAEICMLAAFGQVIIPVYRLVRVAILATGDELVEPGEAVGAGQIINSNSFALVAALRDIGAEPILLGIARDNRDSHLNKLREGLSADALITTAGVSAGDRDIVREILEQLNVKPLFWKVDIKPGRPTAFALNGEKPVFSLPGNPVSTMITFEELVKPALLKMMGHQQLIPPTVTATLQQDVRKKKGRVFFLRVHIQRDQDTYRVNPSGDQNTGILKTMVNADGLAILPAERDFFAAGEQVAVHLIKNPLFGSVIESP